VSRVNGAGASDNEPKLEMHFAQECEVVNILSVGALIHAKTYRDRAGAVSLSLRGVQRKAWSFFANNLVSPVIPNSSC